ncbi:MAG: TMEM165/GDT1 family protein [Gemmatimonadaceae bacterium]
MSLLERAQPYTPPVVTTRHLGKDSGAYKLGRDTDGSRMVGAFTATFGAVLLAEVAGDKLVYTTGVLASRYRAAPVMAGITVAFMVKMGVAVALGSVLAQLPSWLLACLTMVSFVSVAVVVGRREPATTPSPARASGRRGAIVAFVSVVLSEWGDAGQFAAAAMAARFASPVVVWLAAVGAVVVKGAVAASVGDSMRRWLSARFAPMTLRYGGAALLLVIGAFSVVEVLQRSAP